MLIRELLQSTKKNLITCRPDSTLLVAAQLLTTNRIGAMPVLTAEGDLAGIVSERDLVREFANRSGQLQAAKVEDVMTRNVITISADDPASVAAGRMGKHSIRHLPVVEGSKVLAVISIRDIVSAVVADAASKAKRLREFVDKV